MTILHKRRWWPCHILEPQHPSLSEFSPTGEQMSHKREHRGFPRKEGLLGRLGSGICYIHPHHPPPVNLNNCPYLQRSWKIGHKRGNVHKDLFWRDWTKLVASGPISHNDRAQIQRNENTCVWCGVRGIVVSIGVCKGICGWSKKWQRK